MKLSVIIPCYNEEGNVNLMFNEVVKVFKGFKGDYELIFVNDGSRDNTLVELKKICKDKSTNIKVVNFSRNFGKEAAMLAGLKNSVGDYVSIIDADLQQDPSILLDMVKILDENEDYDSVCCYQEKRKENFIVSGLKKCFYKFINKISDVKFTDGASDFRTFRRSVCESMIDLGEYHRFTKGIFAYVGYNTYFMPYKVNERASGVSKWNLKSLFKYAYDGIIAFSLVPLKLGRYIGSLFVFGSFIYLIVALILRTNITTMMMFFLLAFFSGVQLLVLSVVCDYISKMYGEVKNRPVYIVRDIITNKKSK